MARGIGFDVGQFLSPMRGNPLGGAALQLQATLAGAGAAGHGASLFQRGRLANQQDRLQRDQMAQQNDQFGIAQGGINARAEAQLEFQRQQQAMALAQKQREAGAELQGKAVEAYRRGDQTALAQIQAQAKMLDPMMRMTLPGAAPQPRVDPALPSVDEAYPLDPGLTMERGGQQLYNEPQDVVRQREMDVAGAGFSSLLKGPFGQAYAPGFDAGMASAGRGRTGREAQEFGYKVGADERDTLAAMQRAETMSGHRSSGQDLQFDRFKHEAVTKIVQNVVGNQKLKSDNENIAKLEQVKQLMASGAPLAQKMAAWNQMRTVMVGSLSDRDMNAYFGGAGKFTQWEQTMNNYLAGGEMPPEFAEQAVKAAGLTQQAMKTRVMQMGRGARDQVYASPGVPFRSPEEMAEFGMQAYSGVTQEPVTREEVAMEAERLRQLYPGRFSGVSQRGTRSSESFSVGQSQGGMPPGPAVGAGDVLPVTGPKGSRVPPIPRARDDAGGGTDDAALLQLLGGP